MDKKNIPLGFVFGRDSFITFLEYLDSEFEKNVADPKKAFNNPAGNFKGKPFDRNKYLGSPHKFYFLNSLN